MINRVKAHNKALSKESRAIYVFGGFFYHLANNYCESVDSVAA